MPVGISITQRFCDTCNQLRMHKIEYHHVPYDYIIKECKKCGTLTTQSNGNSSTAQPDINKIKQDNLVVKSTAQPNK